MRWIYLILASCCEIAWFYCIGYLNEVTFKDIYTFSFIERENAGLISLSILGYIVFGVVNMLLFAKAIQKIQPAIAFSVWTGLALVGIAVVDGLLMNIQLSILQIGSIGLILAGIIGLKFYGNT